MDREVILLISAAHSLYEAIEDYLADRNLLRLIFGISMVVFVYATSTKDYKD